MSNIIRTNVNYAFNQPLNLENPQPIVAKRDPTTADKAPIGQEWVNTSTNTVFFLTSIANNAANWVSVSGGAGVFSSLTVNPGPTNLSTVGNGAVTIGNATNTGAITLSVGTGNLAINGNAHTIAIGNDAAANTVNIGSNTGTSSTTINSGTGAITLSPAVTGTVVIGTAAETGSLTLGLSTAGQTINIGNAVNAGAQVVNISSGAGAANSTVNVLNGISTAGVQTFNLLSNAAQTIGGVIQIGTGTAANQVFIGSGTGAASTTINGGTAAINLIPTAGNISMSPNVSTPVASPTATVVANNRLGSATFTGFTTAAAGLQVFTVTNSFVTAASAIFVSVSNTGTNNALMTKQGVVPGAGTFNVATANNGTQALNGNVIINWWVIN